MSIYDIDFNKSAENLLPPDKRTSVMKAWVKALLYPIRYLGTYLSWYLNGVDYDDYDGATSYVVGDYSYRIDRVYICIQDDPGGNAPETTTGALYWAPVIRTTDNTLHIVGAKERVKYDNSHKRFEWMLNKKFGGTFAQPPTNSDIYCTAIAYNQPSFNVGGMALHSSAVGSYVSTGFVGNTTQLDTAPSFTINIPTALHTAITGGDNEIRAFADKYVLAGINYIITTY